MTDKQNDQGFSRERERERGGGRASRAFEPDVSIAVTG